MRYQEILIALVNKIEEMNHAAPNDGEMLKDDATEINRLSKELLAEFDHIHA